MKKFGAAARWVAVAVAAMATAACGAETSPKVAPIGATPSEVVIADSGGGPEWCEATAVLMDFLEASDWEESFNGKVATDGVAKQAKLAELNTAWQAVGPSGHDADWAEYDEYFEYLGALFTASTYQTARRFQVQDHSKEMTTARAHIKEALAQRCPTLTNVNL